MRIKEDLINKEVLDGGADLIGKVIDVVMDKDTFEVTDLVIKKTGNSPILFASPDIVA